MNKLTRSLFGLKRAARRAIQVGWKGPFKELPPETQIALQTTGNIRPPLRDDKKRFSKSSGKRGYGHFSGYAWSHLDRLSLIYRAHDREWRADEQTN
jgi:hypothetical protein